MPIKTLFLIFGTTLALSLGQVLFKLAAVDGGASRSLFSMLFSWKMIAALSVYAFATLMWVVALRVVPLTAAYPIVALAYVIVPVLAHFWLGEALSSKVLLGGAVIVFGVWLSVRS